MIGVGQIEIAGSAGVRLAEAGVHSVTEHGGLRDERRVAHGGRVAGIASQLVHHAAPSRPRLLLEIGPGGVPVGIAHTRGPNLRGKGVVIDRRCVGGQVVFQLEIQGRRRLGTGLDVEGNAELLAGPQHAGRPSETGADQLEVGGGEVAVGQAQSRLAARGEDQDRRGHVDVAGVFINDLALEDSAGPVVRRQEQLRGEGPLRRRLHLDRAGERRRGALRGRDHHAVSAGGGPIEVEGGGNRAGVLNQDLGGGERAARTGQLERIPGRQLPAADLECHRAAVAGGRRRNGRERELRRGGGERERDRRGRQGASVGNHVIRRARLRRRDQQRRVGRVELLALELEIRRCGNVTLGGIQFDVTGGGLRRQIDEQVFIGAGRDLIPNGLAAGAELIRGGRVVDGQRRQTQRCGDLREADTGPLVGPLENVAGGVGHDLPEIIARQAPGNGHGGRQVERLTRPQRNAVGDQHVAGGDHRLARTGIEHEVDFVVPRADGRAATQIALGPSNGGLLASDGRGRSHDVAGGQIDRRGGRFDELEGADVGIKAAGVGHSGLRGGPRIVVARIAKLVAGRGDRAVARVDRRAQVVQAVVARRGVDVFGIGRDVAVGPGRVRQAAVVHRAADRRPDVGVGDRHRAVRLDADLQAVGHQAVRGRDAPAGVGIHADAIVVERAVDDQHR